jgi:hypothetical protein
MESQLLEENVMSRRTGIKSKKRHNFWSDRWIALKVLQLFSEAVFLVVAMESLLVEENALWRETGMTGEKGHHFWSDRWIAIKLLQ